MSKKIVVMALFTLIVIITACSSEPSLPDLEGMTRDEIEETLNDEGWEVNFNVRSAITKDESYMFVEYGQILENQDFVTVIISGEVFDPDLYFEPIDMDYDGPKLESHYFDEPYYTYDDEEDVYIGGGGAFEVTYDQSGCIDGDTTVFTYPEEIYERIESNTPSVRYLNMDTTETWPPGEEEEWGQPATQYVCDVLDDAYNIVLQTDPGDNLLGNYGRLLAWVWVQPSEGDEYELLNYNIVRQGLANVAFEFGAGETDATIYDDIRYNEWMHIAEDRAEEDELGMYGDLLDPYWDYDNDQPHPERWPN